MDQRVSRCTRQQTDRVYRWSAKLSQVEEEEEEEKEEKIVRKVTESERGGSKI